MRLTINPLPNDFSNKAFARQLSLEGFEIIDLVNLALKDNDYVRYIIKFKCEHGILYAQYVVDYQKSDIFNELKNCITTSLNSLEKSTQNKFRFLQFVKDHIFHKFIYEQLEFINYSKLDFDHVARKLCNKHKDAYSFLAVFEKFDLKSSLLGH